MLSEINIAFKQEEYEKCIRLIEEAIDSKQKDRDQTELYYILGECSYYLKKFEQAEEAFLFCIKHNANNTYSMTEQANFKSKHMLARIYASQGQIGAAVKQYIEALFDPNNVDRSGSDEVIKYLETNNINDILAELLSMLKAESHRNNLLKSFKKIQHSNLDYPKEVHIETTGKCNADCEFCPHSELDRKNSEMSDELFTKIVNDLKQIPPDIKFFISPFKVNEPLMDKKFFNRVETINKELPNAYIRYFSNFNMANSKTPELIAGIKNLSGIWISLNSLDEKDYWDMMHLKLPKTIENVKNLFEYSKANKCFNEIVILRVGDGTSKDNEFIKRTEEIFSEYLNQFSTLVLSRGEWINHITRSTNSMSEKPCLRWFEISITCTGKVAFCCMDGKCDYPIGDVNSQSILEIYNSPKYRKYRENGYERRFIEPCRFCSYD